MTINEIRRAVNKISKLRYKILNFCPQDMELYGWVLSSSTGKESSQYEFKKKLKLVPKGKVTVSIYSHTSIPSSKFPLYFEANSFGDIHIMYCNCATYIASFVCQCSQLTYP